MPKLTDEEKQKRVIEKEIKNLEKLRKKFMALPFTYTSVFSDGEEYESVGKFDAINCEFNFKGFKIHDVSEDAELTQSTTMFYFPDGSTQEISFSRKDGGFDLSDLENDPKEVLNHIHDNLAVLRKIDLELAMSKIPTPEDTSAKTNTFKL